MTKPSIMFVVGGGTAGLTVAKRLPEDTSVTVAVIEAGTIYQIADPVAEIPGGDGTFVGTTESLPTVDWGFFTAPDPASDNKKRSYARGKCVGGRYVSLKDIAAHTNRFSSARNFMIYQRPTVQCLDLWASQTGDSSYVKRPPTK